MAITSVPNYDASAKTLLHCLSIILIVLVYCRQRGTSFRNKWKTPPIFDSRSVLPPDGCFCELSTLFSLLHTQKKSKQTDHILHRFPDKQIHLQTETSIAHRAHRGWAWGCNDCRWLLTARL